MYNANQSPTALPIAIDLNTLDLPSAGSYITQSGDFLFTVAKVEVKASASNQSNLMIVASLRIVEGELAGSTVVDRLNIVNTSADAQRIALQTLKAYTTALGITGTIADAQQLVNGNTFRAHVTATEERSKKDSNKKVWMNQVSNIRNADGSDLVDASHSSGGYQVAAPAPSAPAPSAPAPSAPAPSAPQQGGQYGSPTAPQQTQATQQQQQPQYSAPQQQQQQPQAPQQATWQAPTAPQGGQPQAPSFVPQG